MEAISGEMPMPSRQTVGSPTYSGSCQCGAISFEAKGSALFCSHCHCNYCRKSHGSAFVTWVGYLQENVTITTHNQASLSWFESSSFSQRGFCKCCGSRLFFKSSLCEGELHIARATFNESIDTLPEQHDFFDQTQEWAMPDADIPKVLSCDASLARYKEIPRG